MNFLGIHSGKKEGVTASCVDVVLEEARKRRCETKCIALHDYTILPITKVSDDPEHISYPGDTPDDMNAIYESVLWADGVVFGTPVNWFSVSSEMKLFLDRLTVFENAGFLLEGKVAGFIARGNEAGEMNALMQLMATTNHMGMISPPYALIYIHEHEGHSWAKRDLRLLGKNMVELIRATRGTANFDYEEGMGKI